MPALATTSLRRLLPYYRPYRRPLATGLMLVVISSASASLIPWLLRAAVDAISQGAPVRRVTALAGAMLGVALVTGGMRYWMRELLNGMSRWIEFDLRNALFARLTELDAEFYAGMRTGEIMARLTNDVSAVRMAVGPAVMYLTNTIFGGIFALVFMLRIDVRLTVLALTPMVLLPIVMARLGRAIHVRFEAVQQHFGTLTTLAQENLAGVRVVRAYRQEAPELARFTTQSAEYVERNMALARLYGVMHPVTTLLAGAGALVVLAVGGGLALRGTISVGAFVAFGMYLGMLTWPLIALGWVTNLFQRGAASMARLLEILDSRSSIAEDSVGAQSVGGPLHGTGRHVASVGGPLHGTGRRASGAHGPVEGSPDLLPGQVVGEQESSAPEGRDSRHVVDPDAPGREGSYGDRAGR
ncbi:MAG: ABC transporter transmembrane domain-containing protein, partial [Gemmatimonadaceae bacterium]